MPAPATPPQSHTIRNLLGESEMGRRVLAFDWSATPLGPIEKWPAALAIAVGICLNSRFPMFVWWGRGLINIYNDSYVPILGEKHPQALGRPARETWSEIWPDVGPQADLVMNEGRATWNERVYLRLERHGYPEDTWFTWSYSPIRDEDGAICGLYCACTEDTPRVHAEAERDRLGHNLEESEKRFRALVNATSDVVYRMSPDWSEMRQLQGNDFLADTAVADASWLERYILPEDRARVGAAIERAIRTRSIFQLEHRVQRVDGSTGWTLSRAVPILDERGAIVEWFGAASDITAQKEAEESLRASEASLKEADRRKDEFLAMLAHELRNPLAPISNAVHAMRLSPEPESARKALGVMDRQIRQMVRLVDDLLDVSRITQGKVALQKEAVPLAEVLDAAIETVRPLIENREQELAVRVPPGIWLDADRARLSQVFANILHNATKFSPRGSAISVTGQKTDGGVTVEIADRGIGIPPAQLSSIFDIFAQVDHSMERTHSGLGIGLTIVKTLLEMHGGSVEALSDGEGTGATFRMHLPTREAPGAAAKPAAAPRAGADPLRVLIVDDNRDSAQTLGMMLRLLGHEVELQYDGPSALAAASKFGPDAVFLDIGMPGMSGYEVCRRLRADGGNGLVVVAQTGWGDEKQRSRSQEAGFDHHLVKPVDLAALKGLLSSIAQRAR
ncbi:MAG TPA: ATP-binding protein [Burkholderiales bacterium]|nr:ATP-binding protein [Burkholderiales bacterium]